MFSYSEWHGQSSLLHKSGTVEFNTSYVTRCKPLWLACLKLLGVAVMVAVGYGLLVPGLMHLQFSAWQAAAIASGLMMIYMGVAFFVRPEANTDNLGWGGGLANDPFQYSDNVNRFLWQAHCLLGPGRFTAETVLDFCVLVGLASREEVMDDHPEEAEEIAPLDYATAMIAAAEERRAAPSLPAQPLPAAPAVAGQLDPNRFEGASGRRGQFGG
ncbi:MAG TPA: hypothetical protein VFV87_00415 [Pirellulaceae bacterium]|nr:hypothetical protein [Pirellulaceae bacterium]